jgi:hypothetical protein
VYVSMATRPRFDKYRRTRGSIASSKSTTLLYQLAREEIQQS